MTDIDKKVMDLIDAGGMTFSDIARKVGRTRSRVYQIAKSNGISAKDLRVKWRKWPKELKTTCKRPWCGGEFAYMAKSVDQSPRSFCSDECRRPVRHFENYCYRCDTFHDPKDLRKAGRKRYADGHVAQLRICPECTAKLMELSEACRKRDLGKRAAYQKAYYHRNREKCLEYQKKTQRDKAEGRG